MLMRPLRSHRLTLLAAGALLASPLLGGCGFNYQTDQVNVISAGINERSGDVDVLGAVVIAGQDDLGLFVATLVNTSEEPVTFEALQATDEIGPLEETAGTEIPAGGQANLFQTGGIPVEGAFKAGDFVTVSLSFDSGQTSTLEINVVTACRQYSLDKLTELELPQGETAAGTETEATETEPTESTESESTESEEGAEGHSDEAEPGPYSCEPASPVEHGGEGAEEGGTGEAPGEEQAE
ncbi:MAG: hypothetical protein JWN84_1274 [Nocardioides sp.]|jgi:hypothetical protein|nr:hypothetical protein [Nocardioides sp.]